MFTTGSKLCFGTATLFLVASSVYLFDARTGGEFAGYWTLMTAFTALVFLGGLLVAVRDANPTPAQLQAMAAAEAVGAPVSPRVSASGWPLVGAVGVLTTAFGLVLDERIFLLGIAIVVAATLEWAMAGWADRASDDPAFNSALRAKIMRPFEVPVFGIVAGAFVVLGFSRVMLAANKTESVVIFGVVAAVVFVGFVVVSYAPALGRALITPLVVLGAAGVLTVGIIGAAQGERTFHHEDAEERKGTETVSNKSGIVATITLRGNAHSVDVQGGGDTIVLPKAVSFNLLFRNADTSKHNIVIEDEAGEHVLVSNFVEQDHVTMVTGRITKPGTYIAKSEGGDVEAKTVITVQ